MSILIFLFFHTCKVLNSESLLLSKQVMVDDGFENSLYNVMNGYCRRMMTGSFIDAVNALVEFACNPAFHEVNFEAIHQLRLCAT